MLHHSKLLAGSLCLSLCGCGTLQAQSRTDPIRVASYTSALGKCVEPQFPGDRRVGTINLDCFTFSGDSQLAYTLAANNAAYRNRLASFLMNESNTVCTREMGNLTANEAMVNAGLATATTAFSTVGSLVTGQLASNVLSGLASGANATRGHINAEVYRSVLSTAVSKAIQNKRDDQRTAIVAHFSDAITAYPVDLMLMDVNNYHQTCSFYRGLGLVIDAVSRPTDGESDQRLRAQAALAQRQLQVASLERQLSQVPAGEQHDAKRDALKQKLQAAQDKYDAAIDTLAAVGMPSAPATAPQQEPDPVENTTTNGQ